MEFFGTLLFLDLGAGELFIIMMAVLLLFGSKKIPELARGLGRGIREIKDATQNIQNEISRSAEMKPASPPEVKPAPELAPPPGTLPRTPVQPPVSDTPDGGNRVEPGSEPGGNDPRE